MGEAADSPQSYEIRVRGAVSDQVVAAVGASRPAEVTTTMLVTAQDRSALHAVIMRIEDLDLHLISVTPVSAERNM